MKNGITLSIAMFSLFAMSSAEAQTQHCHSIDECMDLTDEIKAELGRIYQFKLTGVIKKEANYYEAEHICRKLGLRLPTAREFALFGRMFGARALQEPAPELRDVSVFRSEAVQDEITKMKRRSYSPVYKNLEDGRVVVDFYYHSGDFSGDSTFSKRVFWSSSPVPQYESIRSFTYKDRIKDEYFYTFSGHGEILETLGTDTEKSYYTFAVRCMKTP